MVRIISISQSLLQQLLELLQQQPAAQLLRTQDTLQLLQALQQRFPLLLLPPLAHRTRHAPALAQVRPADAAGLGQALLDVFRPQVEDFEAFAGDEGLEVARRRAHFEGVRRNT